MRPRIKQLLIAVVIVAATAAVYVFNFGLYPRYFDIEWNEEVQLHSGRITVVHVKRTFERVGARLSRYDEQKSILRRNTYTFKVGQDDQVVVLSTRMPVAYLGELSGKWYAVISGQGPYGNFPDEMPDHWGSDFTTLEQRLAILKEGKFVPIGWGQAPPELVRMNLLPSIPLLEVVALNGRKVTLEQKRQFEQSYPTPYARQITRPLPAQQSQGARK